ncbi:unnamed protein product [Spirodela intermedia]|uniref:ABC transporter domain-containing protein n=1 Tax=Spirodela intermedia TaxID=51605 RepID=A0A7I8JHB0_SPIIN|nr:unnamed protein product [Spirodela intermedia]CAA6669549.1 unnamed protein product [Spirodela intermedia]
MSPLSQALWRRRLSWKDLTVTATVGGGEAKAVLTGVTGYAKPRTMTSTLLDALSGRLPSNAFLSGTPPSMARNTKLSFGTAAYVTQEDNLISTLTVRETISYTAHLRLPEKMPWSEKKCLVDGTIDEMGLRDCADTPIGNWYLRGISTGEKRRVSIAVEILMRPRLLFLDEPISGLDSASAFFVVQTLRNLARDGRTVIASVHQPSNEVFDLFDHLCLLSGGESSTSARHRKQSPIVKFFTHAGFPCPPLRNPSDHFLRCINSDFDKVGATLKSERGVDPPEEVTAAEATLRLIHLYNTSPYSRATREEVEEMAKVEGLVLESMGSQASFLMQTRTLVRRSFTNMWRDFGYYRMRFIIYVIVSICIGTINWNLGTSYTAIQSRGACSAFVFGFVTFMSVGGSPPSNSLIETLGVQVFQRERLNGHYGVAAFAISNTLSAVPFLILISITAGSICYSMVRLHPGFSHYLFFVLGLYASITVVESLMMVVATFVPNFLMGLMIGAGIQSLMFRGPGIFMLVSGHYRLPQDLPKPVWKYPLSYISFHFWALQYVLQKLLRVSIQRSKWIDLSVLFSMVIIYRLLFFAMIKAREEVTPRLRRRAARRMLLRQERRGGAADDMALGSLDRSPSLRMQGEGVYIG